MKSPVLLFLVTMGLAAGAAAEEAKKPDSPRFTLVCGAQMQKKTFAIDTAAKTVDGKRASFSASSITWKTGEVKPNKKKGGKQVEAKPGVTHELDRIEGTYRSWTEGEVVANPIIYGCDKAGPVKF